MKNKNPIKAFASLFTQYGGLRREIYVLFFGRIVTNLGAMVWPMLTMILNQKLGMNASVIAWFFLGSGLLMLPANLLGGKLADKYNKKNNIVVCDGISIICYLICAAIPTSFATVVLMMVAGICQSMEYPSYNALIADLTLTKDRERAYSLQYLGTNLGLVLAPTLAGFLFKDLLWLAFLISGVSIGISTLLIFLKVRDITPVEETDAVSVYQKSRETESLFAILKSNKVIVLYVVALALYFTAYGMYSYLMPLDLGAVHGENGAVLYGTISSLNCVIVVIFTPIITKLFKKMTEVKKFIAGEVLIAVGYVVYLLLLGYVPIYYVAITLFTWGEVFATISDGPYVTRRIPASHRGRVNGFSWVLGTVIQSAVELSVGALYDRSGSLSAWTLVLSIIGVSVALTVLLLFRDKKAYPALYDKENIEEEDAEDE